MQDDRSPSLEGAYLRVARAREHIESLDALCRWFLPRAEADGVAGMIGQMNPPYSHYSFVTNERLKIALLFGETVHNLRAALDYLVYELAFKDSGVIQRGTKFPICDTPNDFAANWERWLPGVERKHVAAIYRLQPAGRSKWTRLLRLASNRDKHRELKPVEVFIRPGQNTTEREAPPIGPLPFIEDMIRNGRVGMDIESSLLIHIDRWRPVVNVLQFLETQVTETLRDFDPCFDACEHGPDIGGWPDTPEPRSRRGRRARRWRKETTLHSPPPT